ncbi:MAG: hypothetical protein U0835_03675 [Isosphaeraceae bacterium]
MQGRVRLTLATALSLLLAGSYGCSDNGLNLGKVRGKITYKGAPLPAGEIIFMPDESKGTTGPPALGTVSSDGTYEMSTEESGDGAIVGVHKVGIVGREAKPVSEGGVITDSSSADDVLKVKASMGAPAKKGTGPTVRDRSGAIFKLLTPENLKDPNTSGISIKVERGTNTKNLVIKEDGSISIE